MDPVSAITVNYLEKRPCLEYTFEIKVKELRKTNGKLPKDKKKVYKRKVPTISFNAFQSCEIKITRQEILKSIAIFFPPITNAIHAIKEAIVNLMRTEATEEVHFAC